MRIRHRHLQSPAGKINVTPLIDVVMVLIIFYLIVGKLASDKRDRVTLPHTVVGITDDSSRPFTVTVQGGATSARIMVDGAEVRPEDLAGILRTRGVKESGKPVQVRADRALTYSQVAPVIEACREAGLPSIKLVTDRVGDGG